MKFETKYKICLHKGYFDVGLGLTNYIKYLLFLFGISSQNVSQTLIFAGIWGVSCYFIGRLWYKYEWILAAAEVRNKFDLFMREMRRKIK